MMPRLDCRLTTMTYMRQVRNGEIWTWQTNQVPYLKLSDDIPKWQLHEMLQEVFNPNFNLAKKKKETVKSSSLNLDNSDKFFDCMQGRVLPKHYHKRRILGRTKSD